MVWLGCLSYKVHDGSQVTLRMNKKPLLSEFDGNGEFWLRLSLKCACFLTKAEAHLHNKQNDKVNKFCLDFPRSFPLDSISRTLWHHLTQKWTQTLGILSTSKKGHFFEMWWLPRTTFSFKLHGYQKSPGQEVKQSKLTLFDYKSKCIFLMSLHWLPLQA